MTPDEYKKQWYTNLTEAQLQKYVIDYGMKQGWLCWHAYDSRKNTSGMPDVVLLRMPAMTPQLREAVSLVNHGPGGFKNRHEWRKHIRALLDAWAPGAKHGRLVFAELKREREKPKPEQDLWLLLLGRVPGIEVYVWRPRDMDTILDILK